MMSFERLLSTTSLSSTDQTDPCTLLKIDTL